MRKSLPVRILGGVFLLGLAVFLGVSLVGAAPEDPQPIGHFPSVGRVSNPCGLVGAYSAAYLLYMHGLGAFLVPVFLAMGGVYVLKARESFWRGVGRVAGAFVIVASVSFLAGLVFPRGLEGRLGWLNPLGPGGVWGMVPPGILLPYVGPVGAVFLGFLAFLCGFFLLTPGGTTRALSVLGETTVRAATGSVRFLRAAAGNVLRRLSRRRPAVEAVSAAGGEAAALAVEPKIEEVPPEAPASFQDAEEEPGPPPEPDEEAGEPVPEPPEETVEFKPRKPRRKRPSHRGDAPRRKQSSSRPPVVDFRLPPLSLLQNDTAQECDSEEFLQHRGEIIVKTLRQFGVPARLHTYHLGPAVTLFEIQLEEGVRLSKVAGLSGELAMALRAPTQRLRIMAPIPGRGTVGIEVPNQKQQIVRLRPLLETPEFLLAKDKYSLPLVFGKDLLGRPVTADLAALPHLLIAGTTGSGKSVCINALIVSLAMQKTPEELRFILIDPKQVEMAHYIHLPHLLTPVVTNVKRAVKVLEWATAEMEKRYTLFHRTNARNLAEYNRIPYSQRLARAGIDDPEEAAEMPERLHYVVIVVDEFADLIMQSRKDVETYVQRLAQKARAAGIHLIFATQRPSADVFKGVIKANFPAAAVFHVSSPINSRVVLDEVGAEALLGHGDMLFKSPEFRKPVRAKGAYLSDEEINRVVQFWSSQAQPEFSEEVEAAMAEEDEKPQEESKLPLGAQDDRFEEAVEYIISTGRASASSLQSGLGIGYARANKIITAMEDLGIVGEQKGVKFRDILLTASEWAAKKEDLLKNGGKTSFGEPPPDGPAEEEEPLPDAGPEGEGPLPLPEEGGGGAGAADADGLPGGDAPPSFREEEELSDEEPAQSASAESGAEKGEAAASEFDFPALPDD